MFNVRVREDVTPILDNIEQGLQDQTPLWRNLRDNYISGVITRIFRSNGRGTWRPTQRSNAILRDTRALFRSYTQRGSPGNISQVRPNRFTWGSNLPYARFHEEGTRRLPARPVVGLIVRNRRTNPQVRRFAERYICRFTGGEPSVN